MMKFIFVILFNVVLLKNYSDKNIRDKAKMLIQFILVRQIHLLFQIFVGPRCWEGRENNGQ